MRMIPALLFLMATFCVDFAFAQVSLESSTEQAPVALRTAQALRAFPGGDQIGSVFAGTKVVPQETRGDWTRVRVEAWIAADQLQQEASDGAALQDTAAPASPFQLLDFEITDVSKRESGTDRDRVKLTITLKNLTATPISRWEGWLKVYHRSGSELVRSPISNQQKTIPPGGSDSFSFFWSEKDDAFDYLTRKSKADLRIELQSIRLLN